MSQTTPPGASPIVGRVFMNRYEVLSPIARGGMAEVFKARDQLLGRLVALKVLHPEFAVDQSFVERFKREAQSAANLNHPHIVAVYDWGTEDGTYFMVLEYVEGQSMREVLRSEGRLPVRRVLEIAAETASALHFAHRHNVVHRDVKPGNILITTAGDTKVADFGIARAANTSEGLTQTGAVIGTATYFSPEQAQGFSVDSRSDVYSLGVVIFEALTGSPPFQGDSPVAVAYKHVREDPPRLRAILPEAPADLEAIVAKSLAKSADNRYQSAEELRQDLARFAQGQPVTARPSASAAQVAPTAMVRDTRVAPRTAVAPPSRPVVVDDQVYYDPPRRWPVTTVIVLLIIGILVGLGFLARSLGVFGTESTNQVAVPNIIGTSYDQAGKLIIEQDGLRPVPITRNDPEVAAGLVITTDPPPSIVVERGSVVRVTVSNGKELATVPAVVTLPVAEAEKLLAEKGFTIGSKEVKSDATVEKDRVISQDPQPNSDAAKGSAVNLVISGGKEKVVMPDVVGKNQFDALDQINSLGLRVERKEEPSTKERGEVLRTEPPAGTEIDKGSRVTLFVAGGPPLVKVPNVTGQTEDQAEASLAAVNLEVAIEDRDTTDLQQVGKVISQEPAAGEEIEEGSAVTIVVGRSSRPTTTTTGSSTTTSSSTAATTTTTTTTAG